LQLVENLQGALVNGGYDSGWHSIKSRPQMLVGFRQAILFQQCPARSIAACSSNKAAD
jgi:hypothetical protein